MRTALLARRIGAADAALYPDLVDAVAPERHWRFDETSGTIALDRIAGHGATLTNQPILGVDPLVRNAAGGRSIGLKGGPAPAHVTIADLVTSAAFTLDLALQVDEHPGAGNKYLVVTTGGGSTPGEVSVELEDDGAFGLWVRCWSVDGGGTPVIRHTDPGTVPIGSAFKLSYRRHGDGTQSVSIDGANRALSAESGSDPAGWAAAPSTTWHLGIWPSLIVPFKGLIAELVAWQSAVSDAVLLSLARTRSVVWLGDFDAGSASQSTTKTIDPSLHVFPTRGLIAVKDTDGTLGTVASHGAAFDYLAGATEGLDSFTGHVERGGFSSRSATIIVTVAAGQVKDGTPSDDAVPAGFANPVVDHAATGDGTADDTAELAATLGGSISVWLAPGEAYRITDGVDAAGSNHLICHCASILYDRSVNDGYALDIGSGNQQGRLAQGIRVRNQNQSDWSNSDNDGVRVRELDNSNFEVWESVGFTTGVHLRADDSTCAYNLAWHLGEIRNCRYGVWINEDDPDGGNPWANSNGFLGGRIIVEPGVNTSTDRYGIYVNAHDGVVNHLKFLAPSFDLAEDGTGEAVVMYWHGQTHGIVWYSVENTNDERIADGDNTVSGGSFGAWTEDWAADTQRAIPAEIEINNTRGQQWAVDLRRLTDGAAANNIENAGGVID